MKHKKSKSKKKVKSHKTKHSSNPASSSSDSGSEWVEKPVKNELKVPAKSGFMKPDDPSFHVYGTISSKREIKRQETELSRQKAIYNPAVNPLELNPYWKDGGAGLPSELQEQTSRSVNTTGTPTDDGMTWYRKALQRCKDQAREENKSIEEVAVDRWGSLDSLMKSLNSAEERAGVPLTPKPREYSHSSYKPSNHPGVPRWKKQVNNNSFQKKEEENPKSQHEVEPTSGISLNSLHAKLLKAEIMGDSSLIASLKNKIENFKENSSSSDNKIAEDVTLTRTNRSGTQMPIKDWSQAQGSSHKDLSVRELVERERHVTPQQQHLMFSKLQQQSEFLPEKKTLEPDFDFDPVNHTKKNLAKDELKLDRADRKLAILEHTKRTKSMDRCQFCVEKTKKHLIVSMKKHAYMALPSCQSLVEGHLIVCPNDHYTTSPQLDEDMWEDVCQLQKDLIKFYQAQNKDVVFVEICKDLNLFRHLVIDCIPLDKEDGDMAPIYFKKAIMDSEKEWTQNKKVVPLTSSGVRRAIPKGFPYFAVMFAQDSGFAHVIEDEHRFPLYFGKEIIGGMLDLDHSLWRNPGYDSVENQTKKLIAFKKSWEQFEKN